MNITTEFCIFELVLVPNLTLNKQFWIFELNLSKRVFRVKKRKGEYRYWILHIQISLVTKFQLQLTIWIFWTKFAQTGYFGSQTKKGNENHHRILHIRIRLCTDFSLNWQFRFFGPNLSKKGISDLKNKNHIDFYIFELV